MNLPFWAVGAAAVLLGATVATATVLVVWLASLLRRSRGEGSPDPVPKEGALAPTVEPLAPWEPPEIAEWVLPQLPPPLVVRDDRPFNLGLDFGTHSTKVVGRFRNEDRARVLFLDDGAPGYPSFGVPSLVRLVDGKLFFGGQALQLSEGKLFRSLKVSLLPPVGPVGETVAEFPPGTTPDLLIAAYLAWVLGRIKATLTNQSFDRLSLNVAAPMDHLENEALKERYLQVVHASWEATFGADALTVTQGDDLADLRPRLRHWLSLPVPGLATRRFEVLPETLAPLVSLFQDPRAKPGLYLMADVGAGTTEFSVSRIPEPGADHWVHCFADASVLLGGDQFQRIDEQHADDRKAHQSEEDRLIQEVVRAFHTVWHQGFLKEHDGTPSAREPWKRLRVVMAGGGLRRARLQAALRDRSPLQWFFPLDRTDFRVDWHRPADLDGIADRDDLSAYLAVAHGLSLERRRWPRFCPPREIAGRAPAIRTPDPLEVRHHEYS